MHGKKILVGVTGSIAAYKACDLVQRLKEEGAQVRVVLTPSAEKLVHPNTFAALTGYPVHENAWSGVPGGAMPHIDLARWADLFLIAPCSAHTLAEMAHGLTGSLLSLIYLAFEGPTYVAPAMNSVMLASPAVQRNLDCLRKDGVEILPTDSGQLACGEVGFGKLLEVGQIVALVRSGFALSKVRTFKDKRVLIALGHTREKIDDVRYIANRSSGKTGLALARAFHLAGAQVQLVVGYLEDELPSGFDTFRVATSEEFHKAMVDRKEDADVVIMAAAIADFVPSRIFSGKLAQSKELATLELQPSRDILLELGKTKTTGQVLVGFALETEEELHRGVEKLGRKHCDVFVLNNPVKTQSGFGRNTVLASVTLAGATPPALSEMEKEVLADKVLEAVELALQKALTNHP